MSPFSSSLLLKALNSWTKRRRVERSCYFLRTDLKSKKFLCKRTCKYELNSSTLEGKQCWEGDWHNSTCCPTFFAGQRSHTNGDGMQGFWFVSGAARAKCCWFSQCLFIFLGRKPLPPVLLLTSRRRCAGRAGPWGCDNGPGKCCRPGTACLSAGPRGWCCRSHAWPWWRRTFMKGTGTHFTCGTHTHTHAEDGQIRERSL